MYVDPVGRRQLGAKEGSKGWTVKGVDTLGLGSTRPFTQLYVMMPVSAEHISF